LLRPNEKLTASNRNEVAARAAEIFSATAFYRSCCPSRAASAPKRPRERLVRMFSFVGDTVLDPFLGSETRRSQLRVGAETALAFPSLSGSEFVV
jgi:hypothetical protein